MCVLRNVIHQPEFFQVRNHPRPRHESFQPRIFSRGLVHMRVVSHHINLRKVMPLAHFEIVRIVRRSYFHHAGAEFAIHIGIRDDRNLPIHQRQQHFLPHQMPVTLVFRMHRHGRIAEHRFRPRGRHHQKFLCDRAATG